MKTGGPAEMVWGWLVVGVLRDPRRPRHGRGGVELSDGRRPVLLVGQAGQDQRPGLVVVHGLVQPARPGRGDGRASTSAWRSSSTPSCNIAFGVPTDPPYTIAIYGVVLFLHALLNTFGIRLVALLNDVSVWWHVVGVAIIFIAMFFLSPHHTDLGTVFTQFVNRTSVDDRRCPSCPCPLRGAHRPAQRAVHADGL